MKTKTAKEKFEQMIKEEPDGRAKLKLERAFILGSLNYIENELQLLRLKAATEAKIKIGGSE